MGVVVKAIRLPLVVAVHLRSAKRFVHRADAGRYVCGRLRESFTLANPSHIESSILDGDVLDIGVSGAVTFDTAVGAVRVRTRTRAVVRRGIVVAAIADTAAASVDATIIVTSLGYVCWVILFGALALGRNTQLDNQGVHCE
ncbi:uncharacterized protein PG998_006769 [Apiospora kogelbergensis]|uniref:Uncharacterized protein n=1 Tax=Apiospora kogelbergensis TaxID=1337665 RepID=A0AAW0QQ96_9PEZI